MEKRWNLKEIAEIYKKEGEPKIMAYCATCGRILYSSEEDNFITRDVAGLAAKSHVESFSLQHKCIVFVQEDLQ